MENYNLCPILKGVDTPQIQIEITCLVRKSPLTAK